MFSFLKFPSHKSYILPLYLFLRVFNDQKILNKDVEIPNLEMEVTGFANLGALIVCIVECVLAAKNSV